jgi:hypothetical protein
VLTHGIGHKRRPGAPVVTAPQRQAQGHGAQAARLVHGRQPARPPARLEQHEPPARRVLTASSAAQPAQRRTTSPVTGSMSTMPPRRRAATSVRSVNHATAFAAIPVSTSCSVAQRARFTIRTPIRGPDPGAEMPSATRVPSGEVLHASWYSPKNTGAAVARRDSESKQPTRVAPRIGFERIPTNPAGRATARSSGAVAGASASNEVRLEAPMTAIRHRRLTGRLERACL